MSGSCHQPTLPKPGFPKTDSPLTMPLPHNLPGEEDE